LKIPVVKDIPAAGESLTDQLTVFFTYRMKPGFSNRHSFGANTDQVNIASEQWLRDGTGPLIEHFRTIPVPFLKAEGLYQSNEFATLPQQTQELLE
jgi:hypothetical protein